MTLNVKSQVNLDKLCLHVWCLNERVYHLCDMDTDMCIGIGRIRGYGIFPKNPIRIRFEFLCKKINNMHIN